MKRYSIAQEYLILATTDQGTFPLHQAEQIKAGVVVAGVMDLLYSKVIEIEKYTVEVVDELPETLQHLTVLYAYLKKKKQTLKNIIEHFCLNFTSKQLMQYIHTVGDSLAHVGIVEIQNKGKKAIYLPNDTYKQDSILALKREVLDGEEPSSHNLALLALLAETKTLRQYFSLYEEKHNKERIKALKKAEEHTIAKEMIGHLNATMGFFAAIFLILFILSI